MSQLFIKNLKKISIMDFSLADMNCIPNFTWNYLWYTTISMSIWFFLVYLNCLFRMCLCWAQLLGIWPWRKGLCHNMVWLLHCLSQYSQLQCLCLFLPCSNLLLQVWQTGHNIIKNLHLQFRNFWNKLEGLPQACLSSQVKCLLVTPGANPRVGKLERCFTLVDFNFTSKY